MKRSQKIFISLVFTGGRIGAFFVSVRSSETTDEWIFHIGRAAQPSGAIVGWEFTLQEMPEMDFGLIITGLQESTLKQLLRNPIKLMKRPWRMFRSILLRHQSLGMVNVWMPFRANFLPFPCVRFPYLFPSGGSAIVMETDRVFLKGDSIETFLQMLNTKTPLNRCLSGSALLVRPDELWVCLPLLTRGH